MHFWNFVLLCWGYMFLPLISEQLKSFWQSKNKFSYKEVPRNREDNENIQFLLSKNVNPAMKFL